MNGHHFEWGTRGVYVIVVGLLLVLFALLVTGIRFNSFTADEPAYIGGGYALWARGAEAFSFLSRRGYPPLLGGLEATLLYLSNPNIPVEQLTGWPEVYDIHFVQAFRPYMLPLERTQVISRTPIVLLTVILATVIFRWSKDLWGAKAGLLSVFMLAFDPLILGHGRLAHTDAGVTALGAIALYAVWRWTQQPSWRRALSAGALLSLAMLAKISGTITVAAAVMIVLAVVIQRRRERQTWQRLAEVAGAGGMMFLVFWAAYGFTWGRVRGIPLPAPDYWESLLYLDQYRCEIFAIGYRTWGRWWWYFPLAFLVKNPLPLLIGWVVGLGVFLRRPRLGLRTLILGLFPALYAWIAITRGMNIGYRHMLCRFTLSCTSLQGVGYCYGGEQVESGDAGYWGFWGYGTLWGQSESFPTNSLTSTNLPGGLTEDIATWWILTWTGDSSTGSPKPTCGPIQACLPTLLPLSFARLQDVMSSGRLFCKASA